ncbi:unnamed protein product, partial [Staurois parvus]
MTNQGRLLPRDQLCPMTQRSPGKYSCRLSTALSSRCHNVRKVLPRTRHFSAAHPCHPHVPLSATSSVPPICATSSVPPICATSSVPPICAHQCCLSMQPYQRTSVKEKNYLFANFYIRYKEKLFFFQLICSFLFI